MGICNDITNVVIFQNYIFFWHLNFQPYSVLRDTLCMLVTQVYLRLMVISVIMTKDQDFHPNYRIVIVAT